jgi:hypothetical protein
MSHRVYSDEQKAHILDVYQSVGLTEAWRRTGVDKKTILRWAQAAGIDQHAVTAAISERNRSAAAASGARIARDRAEARERVLNRVIRVSEAAATRELELLARGGFDNEDLQALTNARHKAIQQFELLEGRATSRAESLMDADTLIAGALAAFQIALDLVDPSVRDAVKERFAHELYQVREQGILALEAGDVEDGEIVEEEAA